MSGWGPLQRTVKESRSNVEDVQGNDPKATLYKLNMRKYILHEHMEP